MVYFQTKNPNLGKFLDARCWYILWTFGIFLGHLVYFMVMWYIFPHFPTKKNLATLVRAVVFRDKKVTNEVILPKEQNPKGLRYQLYLPT
jgi:hypothetical protein